MNAYIPQFLPNLASADYYAQYFVYRVNNENKDLQQFSYINAHTMQLSHFIYGPANACKNSSRYIYHGNYEIRHHPSSIDTQHIPKGQSMIPEAFVQLSHLPTAFKMTTDVTIYRWVESQRYAIHRVDNQPTMICRLHGKNEEIHFWCSTFLPCRFTIVSRVSLPSIIHFNTRTKKPIATWFIGNNNNLHRLNGPSYISYWPNGQIREQRWTQYGDYLYVCQPSRTIHDKHGVLRFVEYRTRKYPLVIIVERYDRHGIKLS